MRCTNNEMGGSRFPPTQAGALPVNPSGAHTSAMELLFPPAVVRPEFGSRVTSRMPCHRRLARGRTIVRVPPGERSLTKALPEDRKAPPNSNERKAASGDRKTSPSERLQANAPEGVPVPDSKAELPPIIRRAEVVAFALVSLLVICV